MTATNTFTVYNASAGSGKTYTLVKEYLLLLLQQDKTDVYRNILAITFTNKAVAEMKTRVIYNLNALAAEECPEECHSVMKDLQEETGFTQEKIRSKSQKILKSILHNYASFDISTIDRFTHKIIRTFAKDLGIPLNFEVELNTQLILQEAVDRLINRAGEDKMLTRVLVSFTLSKTDDDKSWDIARDLFSFSKILLHENQQKYIATLKGKTLEDFSAFSAKIKTEIISTENEITGLTNAFFIIVSEEDLDRLDFKSGYVFDYFKKVREGNYKVPFGAKWQSGIDEEKLYTAKLASFKKAILDQYQPEIALLFKASKAAIFKREYLKEILANLVPLSLLSEIAAEIDMIKKERSLLLISDFNPTIAAQVQDQPAPFIYERLGERYKNYFIDEFQDTSQMQWENIIPLIDHALTTEHPNGESSGLTLVGDAKQSIYRFRGGKAEQFIDLYNTAEPFSIKQKIINLPFNYRSAPEIVEFNNSFFNFIAKKFTNPIYRELFATCNQTCKKETEGVVNISFLETENVEEEMEKHPQKVLDIINELENEKVSKSDICILTRTRKQSIAIANYLSEKEISIVSSESLLVSNSREVQFIKTLLEFSINSNDRNLKWEILIYLTRKLEVQDSHSLTNKMLDLDPPTFFTWLEDFGIQFDLQHLKELSLYEASEYIIQRFSLIQKSDAYVQFFLDFVFEKSSQNAIGVHAFLDLWEQNKEKLSISAPKTDNAIQIMTIHQSKGLEFPIVIYPFANYQLRDVRKESLWLPLPDGLNDILYSYFKASKKMENWGPLEAAAYEELLDQSEFDAINVLYVALTRASRQLYIISCLDLSKGEEIPDKVSGLLIGYLKYANLWNGSLEYQLGNKVTPAAKIKPKDTAVHLQNNYSSPGSEVVNLVTKNGELWGSPQENAIQNGILVHNILSEIGHAGDLPKAMAKFRKQENISPLREVELQELILQIMHHPQLSGYFSTEAQVYRERDIISPSGEILRPDRLNFEDQKVTVIDYKTGQLQPSHSKQMEQYAGILSNMGFEVKNKILVYINKEVTASFV